MNTKDYFNPSKGREGFKIRGFAEFLVYEKGKLVDRFCQKNIILNQGKAEVINGLTSGTNRVLARMAIGDRGALPSDSTVPKTPEASRTGLFAEVYRQDVEVTSVTTEDDTNQVLLVTTFRAVDIPVTAYSDQTNPVVNEVGPVIVDLISGNPLPRPSIAAPNAPDADEALFAMRTFKTVPFEAANETAVTVRYTIFIG
jgi:hypothetical protein